MRLERRGSGNQAPGLVGASWLTRTWQRGRRSRLSPALDLLKKPRARVSLVIPIYNVQDHIAACLTSVCAQTYENLEVILVDDGIPTDGSVAVAESFAHRDPRLGH